MRVAYITDNKNPDISDVDKYLKSTAKFFDDATVCDGWINPPAGVNDLENIPIISISAVVLPNVLISGSVTS